MKKKRWKSYAAWILLAEGVGGLSGWLTKEDTKQYGKAIIPPPFSPPAIVFPIVWGVLFLLMGVGAARIYQAPLSRDRSRSLLLFLVQLAFNFGWSILFFKFRRFSRGHGNRYVSRVSGASV
ncbi:MAG: TspO/MBR family protein [Lawsonibacter sp.]